MKKTRKSIQQPPKVWQKEAITSKVFELERWDCNQMKALENIFLSMPNFLMFAQFLAIKKLVEVFVTFFNFLQPPPNQEK